jgi:membrane protein CcdC involved in cytochrome C biogenesis
MQDWCGDTVAWNIGHAIKAIQTADVVPVVRCKDCVYYENKDECVCPYIWMSDGAHLWTMPNDYCSYGEKKEADGNG